MVVIILGEKKLSSSRKSLFEVIRFLREVSKISLCESIFGGRISNLRQLCVCIGALICLKQNWRNASSDSSVKLRGNWHWSQMAILSCRQMGYTVSSGKIFWVNVLNFCRKTSTVKLFSFPIEYNLTFCTATEQKNMGTDNAEEPRQSQKARNPMS